MTDQTPPPAAASPTPPVSDTTVRSTSHTATALAFGGAVALILLVGYIVSQLVYGIQSAIQSLLDGYPGNQASALQAFATSMGSSLVYAVAVGAGVFVALRFFRPIDATTPLRSVLVRGLIATVAATITGTLVSFVGNGVMGASVTGSLFGNSFPGIDFVTQGLQTILYMIAGIPDRFVSLAVPILLVTVLGWLWLRRTPLK